MAGLDRRGFLASSGASLGAGAVLGASVTTGAARPASGGSGKPVLMKLGTQEPSSEANFIRFQRYGIKNVCGWYKIGEQGRRYPTVDELRTVTALGEKYGISIDMTDCDIGRGDRSALMLGKSPERDREIEDFQTTIKNCAAAGIPAIKYYLSILPILRLNEVPGRGDTLYNRWNYADAVAGKGKTLVLGQQEAGAGRENTTRAGHVDADTFWERISYVLERIVPVANEYKVRLAQHPHDPGLPPQGFLGVPNVLGTVEGLKRFVSMQDSPYHGLNFCQGTICEMLDDPAKQVFDVIRWFGQRKKIFNVHFRNIKGRRGDFVAECFPDDGDIDLPATVQVYREVGYDGMLMPDHIPRMAPMGRDARTLKEAEDESFVFAYGYIRGLIQTAARV
ncbi:MAG TPA: mannonate dehydratase [Rhizomicrobium sp.]|jgi:mannonate dehydratase